MDDNDGNEYKVLLLKSDESTLSLNVIGEESLTIDGLTLDGTAVTAKIHVNVDNKLQLDVAAVRRSWSVSTELTVNAIKALAMGGTGCAWNDASCSFGTSRIVYRSFVGHFGAVSISGEKKTFGDISRISASKRHFTIVRFIPESMCLSFKLVCTIFQIRPLRDL